MSDQKQKIIILRKIKSFFINDQSNYKLFFNTYAKNIGFFFIHYFSKKKINFFLALKIITKDILYSSYYKNMKLYYPKKLIKNYKSIIVTWGFKKNFSRNGSFYDNILNSNSSSIKKNLWFVIYLDKEIPKFFKNNIIILSPFISKKINLLFLLKNIFYNLFFRKFISIVFNLQLLSSFSIFADKSNFFFKKFLNKKIRLIFMPYEAQPFQNLFFLSAKKFSKKINTLGYIHSPPEAFPAQSIYKNGCPDKIILNGKDQEYCYTRFLGWKKSKVIIRPSIRFKKQKKKITNKIFLPYSVSNQKDILDNLKYIYYHHHIDIKKFKIQPHPITKNFSEIKSFISQIKKIEKKKDVLFRKSKLCIFIGASGAVTEYLERDVEAIHISDNFTTDFYSSDLYPSIETTKLKDGIFRYKLKKKNNLLKLGNSSQNLRKYLGKY